MQPAAAIVRLECDRAGGMIQGMPLRSAGRQSDYGVYISFAFPPWFPPPMTYSLPLTTAEAAP
jgi:hypothetical protein